VNYPFPLNVGSNYAKDYKQYNKYKGTDKKGAFNLEKEHKIINPHEMDLQTMQKEKYKGFIVQVKEKEKLKRQDDNAPFAQASIYKVSFFDSSGRVPQLAKHRAVGREDPTVSRVPAPLQG
jgi:hypothetical protein